LPARAPDVSRVGAPKQAPAKAEPEPFDSLAALRLGRR
jgi:hypothetical protein